MAESHYDIILKIMNSGAISKLAEGVVSPAVLENIMMKGTSLESALGQVEREAVKALEEYEESLEATGLSDADYAALDAMYEDLEELDLAGDLSAQMSDEELNTLFGEINVVENNISDDVVYGIINAMDNVDTNEEAEMISDNVFRKAEQAGVNEIDINQVVPTEEELLMMSIEDEAEIDAEEKRWLAREAAKRFPESGQRDVDESLASIDERWDALHPVERRVARYWLTTGEWKQAMGIKPWDAATKEEARMYQRAQDIHEVDLEARYQILKLIERRVLPAKYEMSAEDQQWWNGEENKTIETGYAFLRSLVDENGKPLFTLTENNNVSGGGPNSMKHAVAVGFFKRDWRSWMKDDDMQTLWDDSLIAAQRSGTLGGGSGMPPAPRWSPDYGDISGPDVTFSDTSSTQSGLGGIYDQFAEYFTSSEILRETHPNYNFNRAMIEMDVFINSILADEKIAAADSTVKAGLITENIVKAVEVIRNGWWDDSTAEYIEPDPQEAGLQLSELFSWLYTNTYRGRLSNWATEHGLSEEQLYGAVVDVFRNEKGNNESERKTEYSEVMWHIMGPLFKEMSPPSDPDKVGITDEEWYIDNWLIPDYSAAKTGWGRWSTAGPLPLGEDYYSKLIGADKTQAEVFYEAFDSVFPQFQGHFYDDFKEGIYNDSQMAKFLHGDGDQSVYDPDQIRWMGFDTGETGGIVTTRSGWEADKNWYADYIVHRRENQQSLYDNAWELADFLSKNSMSAAGAEYSRISKDEDDSMVDSDVAAAYGLNLENYEDKLRLSWAKHFNPMLYAPNDAKFQNTENNIINMAIAASTPVGTPPTKREWYAQAIRDSYRRHVAEGGNPNDFLAMQLAKGRIVSSQSEYYDVDYARRGEQQRRFIGEDDSLEAAVYGPAGPIGGGFSDVPLDIDVRGVGGNPEDRRYR